jgi:hypothetical protein
MATDYDSLDPLYVSKQVMENADYACSSVPSSNLLHGIECDPRERPLEVLYTSLRPTQPQFSSLGNFQIATQGCSTAGTTLGELWVSYDITFYKKQLTSAVEDSSYLNFSGATVNGGPLLAVDTIYLQKGITIEQIIGTGTKIILPPSQGEGSFQFVITNTNQQAGDQITPVAVNGTITNYGFANTANGLNGIYTGILNISGPGCYAQWALKTTAAGTTFFSIEEVPKGTRVY